ncbi:hypothetical protein HYV89_02715 [Candidatus Woesearchaeota archaeon]|nr:hypothetical protein [Candidatus Woesearchaeota archaeon]
MKKGMIITLPRHDIVTEYLSQFSKQIIRASEDQGIPCKQLRDKEASKEVFENLVKTLGYKLVVLNGHGNPEAVYGQSDKPLVEKGVNHHILSDKITYARSCDSASSLGQAIAKNNKEGCFIGYELPFQFYCDITWEGNPSKDKLAPIFLNPSNLIPIGIVNGKTTAEAHVSSKTSMLKNMNKVLRKSDPDSLAIAAALWNNYEGQVLIGNEKMIL